MEVNNKKSKGEIQLPEKLLEKLSYNQKRIIEVLAKHPEGMLSHRLSHCTGVSNKSDTIKNSLRELLAKYNLSICTKRVPEKRQWLWTLNLISSGE